MMKRRILQLYRDDVAKFAKGYESIVISIFDNRSEVISLFISYITKQI